VKRDLATILQRPEKRQSAAAIIAFWRRFAGAGELQANSRHLVPEESQAFNLERFDGRTVSWDQVEGSLMTPPFLPAKKVVWVENAPYFFSREQKGELGEKILELWREGGRDGAVKLLADL
jgi:hypothetical protein